MGDAPPPDVGIGSGHLPADPSHDETQISTSKHSSTQHSSVPPRSGGHQPFYNQFPSLPSHQQRADSSRPPSHHGQHTYPLQPGQHQQPASSFNMGSMSGALPEYGSNAPGSQFQAGQQPQPQRRLSGASTPAVVYRLQQNLQYPQSATASGFGNPGGISSYGQTQYQSGYAQQLPQQHGGQQASFLPYGPGQPRLNTMPQQPPQFPQMSPQFYYFPGNYNTHNPQSPYSNQFPGSFIRGGHAGAGVFSPTGPAVGFGDVAGSGGEAHFSSKSDRTRSKDL